MFLLLQPNGSRWWRLKYRFEGPENTLSLGMYPQVSLKHARERREALCRTIADGVDHSAIRIVRGNVVYLVCTLWEYQDVRQLALHRITRARLLNMAINRPHGFDLGLYIERGEFQYPVGPRIRLEAIFDRDAGAHLVETPLSDDQSLKHLAGDRVQLRATVRNTKQLEWWLLGFGEGVEVVAPVELRENIRARIAAMHRGEPKVLRYLEHQHEDGQAAQGICPIS